MLFAGIPAAIMQLILPITMGVITRLVSEYGKEDVAPIGVPARIQMAALALIMALSTVILPFMGQNMDVKKADRIKKGIMLNQLFSLVLVGRLIGMFFSKDTMVLDMLHSYLIIISAGYGCYW